jgi:hypothetical protein
MRCLLHGLLSGIQEWMIAIGSTLRRGGLVPAPEAEQPFRTIISRLNLLLRELDRRTGRLPGWPRMEIRWPWSPSSETVSAVSTLPPQRITALPASFGLGLLLANVRSAVPQAAIQQLIYNLFFGCCPARSSGQATRADGKGVSGCDRQTQLQHTVRGRSLRSDHWPTAQKSNRATFMLQLELWCDAINAEHKPCRCNRKAAI